MTEKRIAVLGGGGTGQAVAADLTLSGFNVTLYEAPRFDEALRGLREKGGVVLKGAARQGLARISCLTSNIEEAVAEAHVVIVAVVAQRHGEMAEACAPYLHSGQAVLITPGNAGSLVFADTLKKRAMKSRPLLAEVEGSLCANRLVGDGEVMILFPIRTKYVAAFPGRETEKAVEALSGLYETRPAANIFEAALNSPNVDTHLLGSLLNAGAIDRSGGEYCLYRQGITPSVVRAIESLHEEKASLFRALGYQDRSKPDLLAKLLEPEKHPELALLRNAAGPSSLRQRYVDEDAYAGISLMVSLGELVNQSLPIARGILALASAVNGVDYLRTGRTLKNLGLAGLTVEELNRRLAGNEELPA